MDTNKITIGIKLYGTKLYFKYLANVAVSQNVNIFYPIGREIKYVIYSTKSNGIEYLAYADLPTIKYEDHKIEILDGVKLDSILREFYHHLKKLGIKTYKDEGVEIEYINRQSILDEDPRLVTLIRDKIPKQDQIRPLIDTSDQLFDHFPKANSRISFYLRQNKNSGVNKLGCAPMSYIEQVDTVLGYKYDTDNIMFFDESIGLINYNLLNGNIQTKLDKDLIEKLAAKFKLNFPNSHGTMNISVMAIQLEVNYGSILFNID